MSAPIRLRQICLIADRLEPVLDDLVDVFGLHVCYGKADLTKYGVPKRQFPTYQQAFFEGLGLVSALLPVGESFLEVVAPVKADSAGARYLQRKGPGGYMVITEVDDLAPYAARTAEAGVRLAGRVEYPTYDELQLDPRDIGSAILSFSQQLEGLPFDGGWFPAGPSFRDKIAPGYSRIVGAVLAAREPKKTADRWSAVVGRQAHTSGDGGFIRLDGSELSFIPGNEDRLVAIDVAASTFKEARRRALARGIPVDSDGAIGIGGIQIRPARPGNSQQGGRI